MHLFRENGHSIGRSSCDLADDCHCLLYCSQSASGQIQPAAAGSGPGGAGWMPRLEEAAVADGAAGGRESRWLERDQRLRRKQRHNDEDSATQELSVPSLWSNRESAGAGIFPTDSEPIKIKLPV